MSRHLSILGLLLIALAAAAADPAEALTNLARDPALVQGRLGNGLRYLLLPNLEPAGQVAFGLLVQVGSVDEADEQRGFAGLVERFAFGGTPGFEPGQILEQLPPQGFRFHEYQIPGLPTTATWYQFELVDAKPATIATGLSVLAGWAGGMRLPPEAISQELPTIEHDQYVHSFSADERITAALANVCYPGTPIGQRLPLGISATTAHLDPARLKAFYDAWYRPDHEIIAIVGDLDPQAVEVQVRDKLAWVADRGPLHVAAPPASTAATADQPLTVLLRHEAEAEGTVIQALRVMPEATPAHTVALERHLLCQQVAQNVFDRRIRTIVSRDAMVPISQAALIAYHRYGFAHAGITATARTTDQALAAVSYTLEQYRELLDNPLAVGEFDLARQALRKQLADEVAQATARDDGDLVHSLLQLANAGRAFRSPAQNQDLLGGMLASLTWDEVVKNFKAWRDRPGHDVVSVTGKADLGADGEQQVRARYTQMMMPARAVTAATTTVSAWAYGDLPTRTAKLFMEEWPDQAALGVKIRMRHHEGLQLQAWPSNDHSQRVELALRFDIASDDVRLHRPPGVGEMIQRGLVLGGLVRHPAAEVAAILDPTSVRFTGVEVGDDAITFHATCATDDVTLALQVLQAYSGDAAWRPEAEAEVKQAWLAQLATEDHQPAAMAELTMAGILATTAPWHRPATAAEVTALTFADAKDWLNRAREQAPLTITATGDVPAGILDTMDLWFGRYHVTNHIKLFSIPDLLGQLPAYTVPAPGIRRITVEGGPATGLVRVAWPTDDTFDIVRTRRLAMLAACFADALNRAWVGSSTIVASSSGAAGSSSTAIHVWHTASESCKGEGALQVEMQVLPDQVDQALALIRSTAASLVEQGVDPTAFAAIRTAAVQAATAQKRDPHWWITTALPCFASQPFRPFWAASAVEDQQQTTAADLHGLAQQYLQPGREFGVIVTGGTTSGSQ